MLSKKQRLSGDQIRFLKDEKIRPLSGRFLGLVYKKNEAEQKFGVLISKKIAAKAFLRNKIKRLFYKSLEECMFQVKGHFLFLTKKDAGMCSGDDFKKDILCFKSLLDEKNNP